ncbi:MAG: YfcE family phosphodiesterase [Subtercola sp.]|nr:YfcE family phosphodiesterase [Subtercola sp.]
MALKLVMLADTHLPKRAKALPGLVWRAVDEADVVFHAGDWVDVATLDALESRAARLVGVFGNNDGPKLRERLPEVARVTLDGLRFAMVHETGPAAGREQRADRDFADADVLVFGHSHIPWNTRTPAGMLLLNPGSPTDRRRQPVATFLTAEIIDSQLRNVVLVPVSAGSEPPSSAAG